MFTGEPKGYAQSLPTYEIQPDTKRARSLATILASLHSSTAHNEVEKKKARQGVPLVEPPPHPTIRHLQRAYASLLSCGMLFRTLATRKSVFGFPLTIFDGGRDPSKKSLTARQTSDNTRSPASSVEPPMCGEHITFGSLSAAEYGHRDYQHRTQGHSESQHFGSIWRIVDRDRAYPFLRPYSINQGECKQHTGRASAVFDKLTCTG